MGLVFRAAALAIITIILTMLGLIFLSDWSVGLIGDYGELTSRLTFLGLAVIVLLGSLAASAWLVLSAPRPVHVVPALLVGAGLSLLVLRRLALEINDVVRLFGTSDFATFVINGLAALAILAGLVLYVVKSGRKRLPLVGATLTGIGIVLAFVWQQPEDSMLAPPAAEMAPPAAEMAPPAAEMAPPAAEMAPPAAEMAPPAAGLPLPTYPWPPEDPSSLVRLDLLYPDIRRANSLFQVGEFLLVALQEARYFDMSFYSAPGGFVMVTRLEGIDVTGAPLGDARRYLLPDDQREFSFGDYVRSLFFAPEGYYRFIAFVVSDVSYATKDEVLSEIAALERLRRGGVALPQEYRYLPFSPSHRIDALIYEFRKGGRDRDVETLRPGRLSPLTHLANSGLSSAFELVLLSR